VSVLLLATESPVPAHGGYALRLLHQARALAGAGLGPVTVLALGPVPDQADEPFTLVGVAHSPSRWQVLARSLRQPYLAAWCSSAALHDRVERGGWDLVLASSPFLVEAAGLAGAPVLLDVDNVEHEVARTLADTDPSGIRRRRWRWEAGKIEAAERRVAGVVDAVTAPSAHDVATYRALGADPVDLAPNGVDVDRWRWRPPVAGAAIGYVGSYGYRPNEAAAIELVEEVLPLVSSSHADARAVLVGRAPTQAMLDLRSPTVVVTGEVEDLAAHLQALRVLVVPLRAGGGTRLKILEAFAAGVPVVSTSLGAAGLDVVDGEHLLVAERPDQLAGAAVRLVDDDGLAERLARGARALVEERYDWSRTLVPLVARCQALRADAERGS
jgi:glycosyltransferase involved in cell wall biosynthesis